MISVKLSRPAACVAALMTAPAAFADVTPEQVWDNWKANFALYGEDAATIANEDISADSVVISGLTLRSADPEISATTSIAELTFTANGDGTVSVTMPETYVVTFDIPEDNGAIELLATQTNLSLTASGDPGAINYAFAADDYTLEVVEIRGDAAEIEGEFKVTATDLAGNYLVNDSNGLQTTYDLTTGGLDLLVDVKDPSSDDFFVLGGQMTDITTTGEIVIPEGADINDPDTFLASDFRFASETGFGGSAFLFDVLGGGTAAAGSMQMGGAAFGGGVGGDDLAYNFSLSDVALNVQSPVMPFPIDVSWGIIENSLQMPVTASEEPAPFSYTLSLTDVVVSEEIWSMGDPAAVLPRDPVSVALDVSGMAKLFFDIMDPEQAEALEFAEVPGELISLAINSIRLAGVGAEITATGDFTFDNTDLETFDGLPRPAGEINVGITGANSLIDNLIAMGLLPQEQATMGRMFMGMFTQPAGNDALTSKIEINDQGHILANGQRIQ